MFTSKNRCVVMFGLNRDAMNAINRKPMYGFSREVMYGFNREAMAAGSRGREPTDRLHPQPRNPGAAKQRSSGSAELLSPLRGSMRCVGPGLRADARSYMLSRLRR